MGRPTHCELQREECGEVLVTKFKPVFLGENRQETMPQNSPPRFSRTKIQDSITMNFWGRSCVKKHGIWGRFVAVVVSSDFGKFQSLSPESLT